MLDATMARAQALISAFVTEHLIPLTPNAEHGFWTARRMKMGNWEGLTKQASSRLFLGSLLLIRDFHFTVSSLPRAFLSDSQRSIWPTFSARASSSRWRRPTSPSRPPSSK